METQQTKTYKMPKSSSNWEIYSYKCLHKGRKITNKQPNLTYQETKKRRKEGREREGGKDKLSPKLAHERKQKRAEINEIKNEKQ